VPAAARRGRSGVPRTGSWSRRWTRRTGQTPRPPSPRLAWRSTKARGRPLRPSDRAALLWRVADLLVERKDEFARAESLDTGKRLVESEYDIDDVVAVFRYYASLSGAESGRVVDTGRPEIVSRVVHEPIGVCGLITPWNYPLLQTSWKVAPCLAAGNTFVLKPSELTPATAILLMRVLAEAGLPDGVGNLVLGAGAEVGAPLSEHPDVDMVSFTGGIVTGRGIMAAAAGTVKKVALELGGKNANLVFADADPSRSTRPGAGRRVPALRSGVLRRGAAAGRGVHPRRVRRRAGGDGGEDPAGWALR
jgi:acyl-CoA reductase-like NAD-dependent aldehyde dehydrogenase